MIQRRQAIEKETLEIREDMKEAADYSIDLAQQIVKAKGLVDECQKEFDKNDPHTVFILRRKGLLKNQLSKV